MVFFSILSPLLVLNNLYISYNLLGDYYKKYDYKLY